MLVGKDTLRTPAGTWGNKCRPPRALGERPRRGPGGACAAGPSTRGASAPAKEDSGQEPPEAPLRPCGEQALETLRRWGAAPRWQGCAEGGPAAAASWGEVTLGLMLTPLHLRDKSSLRGAGGGRPDTHRTGARGAGPAARPPRRCVRCAAHPYAACGLPTDEQGRLFNRTRRSRSLYPEPCQLPLGHPSCGC